MDELLPVLRQPPDRAEHALRRGFEIDWRAWLKLLIATLREEESLYDEHPTVTRNQLRSFGDLDTQDAMNECLSVLPPDRLDAFLDEHLDAR